MQMRSRYTWLSRFQAAKSCAWHIGGCAVCHQLGTLHLWDKRYSRELLNFHRTHQYPAENMLAPCRQDVILLAPVTPVVRSAGQNVHWACAAAPSSTVYRPSGHFLHDVIRFSSWNVPGAHKSHAMSTPKLPCVTEHAHQFPLFSSITS